MALTALSLYLAYGVLCFGVRTWAQVRRTGDSGFRGISGRPGSPHWWAGGLFAVAVIAGVAGPIGALLGLTPVSVLDRDWIGGVGLLVAVASIGATMLAQHAMGSSWRVGVDATEHTALVQNGPFALVRNPIFSAMVGVGAGLTLMTPNLIALAGFALLCLAIQLQVRVVEEPYLLDVHGSAYATYAARVGRLFPRLGRL